MDERLWVQQDANYNVTALVNGSGSAVERYAYDPFGAVSVYDSSYGTRSTSNYEWVYGFQGMRADAYTGLVEANLRWYSTTLGRWLNLDPIGIAAGDPNYYRFVENNPGTYLDPTGNDIWLLESPSFTVDAIGHSAMLVGNDKTGYVFYSYGTNLQYYSIPLE